MIQKQLSLSNYSNGLYFLTIKNGKSEKTIKVLKED
ncbi:MAG: T9SS type A sorting domain-containing protein [Saprospiraceae bacterium]